MSGSHGWVETLGSDEGSLDSVGVDREGVDLGTVTETPRDCVGTPPSVKGNSNVPHLDRTSGTPSEPRQEGTVTELSRPDPLSPGCPFLRSSG